MSPEQAAGETADRRVDIWAFGVVLFEMLTGRAPFTGKNVSRILAAVLNSEPDWTSLPANLHPRLRLLLERCLQKETADRYHGIADARVDVQAVLNDPTGVSAEPSVQAGATAPQRVWKGIAASFALVTVAALAWALWPEPSQVADIVRFEIPIPENTTFRAADYVRISPDGRRVAFTTGGAEGGIWVRDIESLVSRRLPGTEGVRSPFWSPDSDSIAFGVGNELKRVEVTGGTPQTLADIDFRVGSGAWSPDGTIIFGTVGQGAGLYQVQAVSGVATELTRTDASREEVFHTIPSFLPDGDHFIYFRTSPNPEIEGIYIGSLNLEPEEQSSERLLGVPFGAYYADGRIFFMPEPGILMAQSFDTVRLELIGDPIRVADEVGIGANHAHFSASANGTVAHRTGNTAGSTVRIAWFDRAGSELDQVAETFDSRNLSMSPDGRWASVDQSAEDGSLDVWRIDLAGGALKRLTVDEANESDSEWSPDGRVVFRSNRDADSDLYVTEHTAVAGSEILLRAIPDGQVPSDWSSDGRFIVFETGTSRLGDIWAVNVDGEGEPLPVVQTDFDERGGQLSPDGNWIAYQQDLSGLHEIYVQPFPDGTNNVTPVTSGGGIQAHWGPDGSELFYVSLADGPLMRVPIALPPDSGISPEISAAESLFPAHLGYAPFRGDQTQQYAVAPDGERFLMVTGPGPGREEPITVILNWNPEIDE